MAFVERTDDFPPIRDLAQFDPQSGNLIERLVFNNRGVIFVAFLVITAVLAWSAVTKLQMLGSFEKMLPKDHPYVKNYKANADSLRALGNVVRLAVETDGETIYTAEFLKTLQDVSNEEQNVRQKHLLEMLRIGLSWYLEEHDLSYVADFMVESLLMLTESKFGLAGGIHHDEHNNPYMKCHTVSNIGWDSSAQDFYTTHYSKGLEFHNLDNLIGEVIKTGRPVISNNPAQDPRRGGLPHGYPPLESYLGVPIFRGDKLIAMYCLANKRHGYEEDIIEFLKPFNVTYSAIIQASGMIKTQRETL